MAIPLATLIPFLIQAGSTVPALIPGKAERENKKALGSLKDLLESNELGLTDEEKNTIRAAQSAKAQTELKRAADDAARLGSAGMGMGSGQYLKAASIRGAEGAKIGTGIEQNVALADAAKEEAQRQEYEQRLAASDAYRQQKTSAITGLGTGIATGIQKDVLAGKTAGGVNLSAEMKDMVKELAESLGLTEAEVLKSLGL